LLQAYLDLKAFYYSNEGQQELSLNQPAFINKIASELEPIEKQIKALQVKNNQINQVFDTLTNNSIQITLQALVEKDQTIRKLQQQLTQKEVAQ
jgi:hypothetical protein